MNAAFYIIAIVTLASAVAAMSLRKLVHCALSLVVTFLGVAAMFLHLNAPFVAFAQVLVYVGAIAILIVFAILLTRNSEEKEKRSSGGVLAGIGIATLVALTILIALIPKPASLSTERQISEPGVQEIGTQLMTTHVIPLEIVALLLTAATIGAVVIALQDEKAK